MNINFLKYLIRLSFHGKRHEISGFYVDLQSWTEKKQIREDKISEWSHNNGIGV